jgi:hypothetical protein
MRTQKKSAKDDRSAQIEKFRETARVLKTDDSEAAFDKVLLQVAKNGKAGERHIPRQSKT